MKLTNRGWVAPIVAAAIVVAAVTTDIATRSNPASTRGANVGAVQNSIPLSQKGAANGVATLDGSRHLTQKQLLTGGTEGECLQRKGTEELKWGTCASGGSGKSQGEIEEFALARSKNLSDLASASTARTNLGAASTTEVNLKAPIASPTFTGTPASETALAKDNTSQIATDKFVQTAKTEAESNSLAKANNSVLTANINAGAVTEPKLTQGTEGKLVPTGGEAGQCLARKGTTELTFLACSGGKSQAEIEVFAATKTEINLKAPIESPNFTGTPELSVSPIESTNNKRIATTKFVHEVATSEKAAAESNSLAKASNSVKEINIETGAVTEGKIGSEAVAEAKIKALAVTAGKLGAEAVEEGKIKALAVSTAKLAAEAVTAAKIATGAITAVKIGSEAVETAAIKALAVTAGKLGEESVETAKIKTAAVTLPKIGVGGGTKAVGKALCVKTGETEFEWCAAGLSVGSVLPEFLSEESLPAVTTQSATTATTALKLKKRIFKQLFTLNMEHETTVEFTEPPTTAPVEIVLHFIQGSGTTFKLKMPAETKWVGGEEPPFSTWTAKSTEYTVTCEIAEGHNTKPWCTGYFIPVPAGGTEGQLLVKGATGPEWKTVLSVPAKSTEGFVLTQGASAPEWKADANQVKHTLETHTWSEAGEVKNATLPGFFTAVSTGETQKFVKLICKIRKVRSLRLSVKKAPKSLV